MVALIEERDMITNDGDGGGPQTNYGSVAEAKNNGNRSEERKPLVLPTTNTTSNDAGEALYCTTATTTTSTLTDTELLQDEISGMTKLAIPVILTYLLETLPGLVTIILVGRVEYNEYEDNDINNIINDQGDGVGQMSMQKLHLDAASLAVMFVNVVALSPAYGVLTAMDTLCSNAHGANQPAKMGTYSLTGLLVVTFIFLTSSILIWNASTILISLGQPLDVSYHAGTFIRYSLPGVPFLYIYELIRKIFQARNEATPMLITVVIQNLVNVVVGWYLVRYTAWGWLGASVARTLGNIVTVPVVLICMSMGIGKQNNNNGVVGKKYDTSSSNGEEWSGQHYLEVASGNKNTAGDEDEPKSEENDREFLQHLWEGFVVSEAFNAKSIIEFLSLGIPGMCQVMFEWCAFEFIALLCGILPGEEAIIGIGANTIIMNISSVTYMFYLGASVSGNVRIGNALGAGDAHRAKIASNLTLIIGGIMSAVNTAFLLGFRNILPWIFTTDLDIGRKAQHLFLIAAAFQFPDAINGCFQGIFRGSGRQALAAYVNFAAFYIVGIPLGYVLGIKLGFGVEGLWIGITTGLVFICIVNSYIVFRSNWRELAIDAAKRLKS